MNHHTRHHDRRLIAEAANIQATKQLLARVTRKVHPENLRLDAEPRAWSAAIDARKKREAMQGQHHRHQSKPPKTTPRLDNRTI
jgi:hypothetical protein